MDVSLGVERRRYVEGENCGDEAYCGCEKMHHVHLFGYNHGICLYLGSVLANMGSYSGLAAGQKGLRITEEKMYDDENVYGVEEKVRR